MARCSFCRKVIEPGTGIMFVKTDGRIFMFCSGKCEKHLLDKEHKPRTTRWTLEYAREKRQLKTAKEGKK
ncbi:MAG: 50S ribosomal protein L24e [Candidatus Woesearchaeota archaeon]